MSSPTIHFTQPPVVEVVFGVAFQELERFTSARVGQYWETIRRDYPHTHDREPLGVLSEVFDVAPEQRLELTHVPPLRRTWFMASDRRRLIQLQADRFLFNRRREDGEYNRFESSLPEFLDAYDGFTGFLSETCSQPVIPLQYELTYVNHIPFSGPFTTLAEVGRVFRPLAWSSADARILAAAPTTLAWKASFDLPDKRGRLHAQVGNGLVVRGNKRDPIVQFQLQARGFHRDELRSWFELAHEWIVKGFADLTTPEMHQHWGGTP